MKPYTIMFTPWKINILFLTVALFYNFYLCSGQSSNCSTPNNKSGIYIKIKRCEQLYNSVLTSGQNRNLSDLFHEFIRDYEGEYPKVCCSLNSDISTITSTTTAGTTAPAIRTTTTARTTTSTIGTMYDMKCGYFNSSIPRITNGQPAELGVWPWMAALFYRNSRKPGLHFHCGGTLITNRHVVTAAHCVLNIGSYTLAAVRLGELDLDDAVQDGASPIDIQVSKITPHSNYSYKLENDIAIITLQNSVQFTEHIRPICLPKEAHLRSDNFNKRKPYIIGWGATEWGGNLSTHLQQAQVPTLNLEKCKEKYTEMEGMVIDNKVICAGDGRKDSCQKDSGGPLMIPHNASFYLIGIVSFGKSCADPNFSGVYTRVTHFLDWIDANTA